jgi:hypothetical protein
VRVAARATVAIVLLLAGCRSFGGPGSAPASPPAATPGVEASVPASGGSAIPLSRPDTPYEAADMLDAMRDSRRPGGVPDQLETQEIAAAIAAQAWTWDGELWETISLGGSCGTSGCSLDLAGAPPGEQGTDLYSFSVDPGTGEVQLLASDLHGHPVALQEQLDAAARAGLGADVLDGMELVASRWLAPPQRDRYWLAYRSGGEEGSPGLDVLLDAASGEVLETLQVED